MGRSPSCSNIYRPMSRMMVSSNGSHRTIYMHTNVIKGENQNLEDKRSNESDRRRMADLLLDLEYVLRSKTNEERIRPDEEELLGMCKVKMVRQFIGVSSFSATAMWAVTRRLPLAHRVNIAVDSALVTGMWTSKRFLNASVNKILDTEGTRMQKELANIILTKHADNTARLKLVRKYFYPEQVFNDANPDRPFFRWRARNLYEDATDDGQRKMDTEDGRNSDKSDQQPKRPIVEKVFQGSQGGDIIAEPLDCIFCLPESNKETSNSDAGELSKKKLRARRKHNRHHRDRDAEGSKVLKI